MPLVTKSQSGQVLNNGSLSVPQSSATAKAGGFESYRNRDMIDAKLLMIGDSVMGCFLQAPEDGDASPGVVFINWSVLFEQ